MKNAERVRLEQIPLPDAPSTQAGKCFHCDMCQEIAGNIIFFLFVCTQTDE